MNETTQKYRRGGLQFISKDILPFVPRKEVKMPEDPLSVAERFFIEKFLPGLLGSFDDGALARMIDCRGKFFLVYMKKIEEEICRREELGFPQVQSQPMSDEDFANFVCDRDREQTALLEQMLARAAVYKAQRKEKEGEQDLLGR
jgi:hypothetical protein